MVAAHAPVRPYRRKVAQHLTIGISEDHFSYPRPGLHHRRAALDGIYVLRSSAVPWRAFAFSGMLASWLRRGTGYEHGAGRTCACGTRSRELGRRLAGPGSLAAIGPV